MQVARPGALGITVPDVGLAMGAMRGIHCIFKYSQVGRYFGS